MGVPLSCHPFAVLAAQRLLPVLRDPDADHAVRRTAALLAAGCRAVELTTSTPGWAAAVARTAPLADAHARAALIGVGTVTGAAQAERALDAGAGLPRLPVPGPRGPRGRRGARGGVHRGRLHPRRGRLRRTVGGAAKVFPAHVGGPGFIRSLKAVLPGALLIPTGGIRPSEARDWLAAGATAVGVGNGLPEDPGELAAVFAELAGPCCCDPAGQDRRHGR